MVGKSSSKVQRSIVLTLAILLALVVVTACAASTPTPPPPTSAPQATQAPTAAAVTKEQELTKLVEAAKAEGSITWGDGLKPEEANPMIKAFNDKYPSIKVEHTRINDTDSRERLFRELQANKVSFDIFDVSGEEIPTFKAAGVMMKVDWLKLFDVRPQMLDPDQQFLAYGGSVKCIAYNTNLVKKEDAPKTWEDLLDPKWQGKLVVDSRPKSFLHLTPVWGEQKVMDYLAKLAANKPTYRRGQTESIQLMAAGDIAIIGGTYYHSVKLVKDKGAPIDVVFPDPVPVSLDFEGIAKASSHPNAAKLFLGWMATEGEKSYDKVTGRGLPFAGYQTGVASLIAGKQLSIFDLTWGLREAELDKKAGKAMGLDK